MSEQRPLPVACTLTADELRGRRDGLIASLAPLAREIRDVGGDGGDGIALRFDPSGDGLAAITGVIDAERRCCRFLRFRLTVEPDEGAVWLELTGPAGTRDFLRSALEGRLSAPGSRLSAAES
ncbi:MAG TPA: hypothetical protein VNA89_14400 [Gemmatimonadaceae bacterium]|nr:hypothetical protein [Gemmatimonadaceae bacterium]